MIAPTPYATLLPNGMNERPLPTACQVMPNVGIVSANGNWKHGGLPQEVIALRQAAQPLARKLDIEALEVVFADTPGDDLAKRNREALLQSTIRQRPVRYQDVPELSKSFKCGAYSAREKDAPLSGVES